MTRRGGLEKVQCPNCAKQGRDRHRDNFVIYPDGGGHCFACGFHLKPKESVTEMSDRILGNMKGHTHSLHTGQLALPQDVGKVYPEQAASLLIDCGLSPEDMLTPHIYYSPTWRRIIFPIFDGMDKLRGWMGRAIDVNQYPKWYTMRSFNTHEYMHILGDTNHTAADDQIPIVVVEDMISQYRVAKHFPCLCLFGIALSETNASLLAQRFHNVVIWLDDGATSHALDHAEKVHTYGARSYIIWTASDPKYHSGSEIVEKVNNAMAICDPREPLDPPSDPPEALRLSDQIAASVPPWCDLADDLGDVMC